jgi:AbrB family looped-hinge helix DNA binding protein
METTLTSKGQLTLPKEIRDRLGLVAGARLDFTLQPDETIRVRVVSTDPLAIACVLPAPARRDVSEVELKAAIRLRGSSRFARSK